MNHAGSRSARFGLGLATLAAVDAHRRRSGAAAPVDPHAHHDGAHRRARRGPRRQAGHGSEAGGFHGLREPRAAADQALLCHCLDRGSVRRRPRAGVAEGARPGSRAAQPAHLPAAARARAVDGALERAQGGRRIRPIEAAAAGSDCRSGLQPRDRFHDRSREDRGGRQAVQGAPHEDRVDAQPVLQRAPGHIRVEDDSGKHPERNRCSLRGGRQPETARDYAGADRRSRAASRKTCGRRRRSCSARKS